MATNNNFVPQYNFIHQTICDSENSNEICNIDERSISNLLVFENDTNIGIVGKNNATTTIFIGITAVLISIFSFSDISYAVDFLAKTDVFNSQLFDTAKFVPVCPASDNFYQFLKGLINALIGSENVAEYGPLIASVLLRVRLELCVLESFIYEAIIPFIKLKGLSWILPLHETFETFLAGTIFAISTNFILLGSTKIIAVILVYIDALIGFPFRVIGGFIKKISSGNVSAVSFGNLLKLIGDISSLLRTNMEKFDTFVGRYLVIGTSAYVVFKFAHFKLFNTLF
jgi:hypothetical protein